MATDTSKLRNMSPDELAKEEVEVREAIWKLRVQMITGQLQDPHKVRLARKELARVLTVRREAELKAVQEESR
jgi:large subunit ribosomal protein L29